MDNEDKAVITTMIDQLDLEGLNNREKDFIQNYRGNPIEAARVAGYAEPLEALKFIAFNDKIQLAIKALDPHINRTMIASEQETLVFWSDIMRDTDEDVKTRLQASTLLGKAQGTLNDKIVVDQRQQSTTTHMNVQINNDLGGVRSPMEEYIRTGKLIPVKHTDEPKEDS